jgi:hypothetical protein
MGGLSKYRKSASLALPRTKKRISVCKQREEAGILLSVLRVQGVPATTPAINVSLVSLTKAIRKCCLPISAYLHLKTKNKQKFNILFKCKLHSTKFLTKYEKIIPQNSLLSPVSLTLLINIHLRIVAKMNSCIVLLSICWLRYSTCRDHQKCRHCNIILQTIYKIHGR